MELYVGLDISQSMTHLCVVDSKGKRIWEGKCCTTPEAIAETIGAKAPNAELIGMESGALTPYLWHQLTATGLPVVCIEARHAHKTLSEQLNKTDKHDARGLPRQRESVPQASTLEAVPDWIVNHHSKHDEVEVRWLIRDHEQGQLLHREFRRGEATIGKHPLRWEPHQIARNQSWLGRPPGLRATSSDEHSK